MNIKESWIRIIKVTLLVLLVFTIAHLYHIHNSKVINNVAVVQTGLLKATNPTIIDQVVLKRIIDIRVGDRVTGQNPEIEEEQRRILLPIFPQPEELRIVYLQFDMGDGKKLDISLLRSLEWIEEVNAVVGYKIDLDMPEFGIKGIAIVRSIEPAPFIVDGPGNIVTGTFRHEVSQATNLYVEGQQKPIGCTDTHPFWSVDRQEFVPVAHLQPGEHLQLFNGETTRVIQKLPRPGPTFVYNIEVYGEHVYEVTDYGILVHNVCWSTARKNFWKEVAKDPKASEKYSPDNIKLMQDGKAPKMRVEVENNKTGKPEIKEISMELHHLDPQRNGGSNDSVNLVEVSPFVHEILDPYRHNAYTLKSVKSGLKEFQSNP